MKKTIFTILIVCFAGVASAQGITFQMGEKTNKKAYDTKMIRIVEGMQDGQLFVVEPELKAISGPKSNPVKSVKVRLCDREWNDTKSITLSDSKKSGIGDAFRSGNRLHVVKLSMTSRWSIFPYRKTTRHLCGQLLRPMDSTTVWFMPCGARRANRKWSQCCLTIT